MPVYEFKCDCGIELEMIQDMDDKHEAICQCGAKMDRVFTGSSFKFKPGARWFDKKRAALDADYARNAHYRAQELKTGRIR